MAEKDFFEKMHERNMFEKSFLRPRNYFKLSGQKQWDIDKALGILDWEGSNLTVEDRERFQAHYEKPKKETEKK